MNVKNIIVINLLLWVCCLFATKAQNVNVTVQEIRSSKGYIVIYIYQDEEGFKEEKAVLTKKYKKTTLSNGQIFVKLNLKPGIYGFALIDDENSDNEMNYNIIGMPKEGFGFSNYYHTGLSRPKFDVFKFEVKENQTQNVVCKMKYM